MKLLVTGAQGFLGRALMAVDAPQVERIGTDRTADPVGYAPCLAAELTDRDEVARLLDRVRPDWVIHTAALTGVDQCEVERDLARAVNLEAVGHLVEACRRTGAGLVQLSTDYVFDGQNGPYREGDPPAPLSFYGRLKLESEGLVLKGLERGLVVRTLWLYGYLPGARPNFVQWVLDALSQGRRLPAFSDQWGNPTYVHDLASALVRLCELDVRGLYHLGGTTFMTRYELAVELARCFAWDPSLVDPVPTASAGLAAARPLRSGLCTEAVECLLGRRLLGFREGLERMAGQEVFRRDCARLIGPPAGG